MKPNNIKTAGNVTDATFSEEWVNTDTGEIQVIQDPTQGLNMGWGGKRAGAGRKPLIEYKEKYFMRVFNVLGEDAVENIQYLIDLRKGNIAGAGPKEGVIAAKILLDKFMPNMVLTKEMSDDPNENKNNEIQINITDYTD